MPQTAPAGVDSYPRVGFARGTVIATFLADPALHPSGRDPTMRSLNVFSCDYNGWADVPEAAREGIDPFEAAGPPTVEHAMKRLLPVRWKDPRRWEPGAGSRRAA